MTMDRVLGFATLEPLLAQQQAYVSQAEFDLRPYDRVDSAGIAFLLELHRQTARQGRRLRIIGAGEQCRRLAAFIGVDTLLGLTPEAIP